MKRILFWLLLCSTGSIFSQNAFPDFINYQAVLRDPNNVVLPSGTIGNLSIKIYDDLVTASATYEETHNFTVNSSGIVNLQIGKGTPVGSNTFTGSVNWAVGKVCYEVYLNGNIIGAKQSFATVPYAIFAKNSGNGMPGGLPNQTMFYDGTQNKWVASNNVNHNGSNVGVGIANTTSGIKMNVVASAADSVALNANKSNAQGGEQAFRAVTSGNTNSSSPDLNQALTGLTSYGSNSGTGMGIGVSGFGSSSGYAYGVIGIGSVTSNTAYGIGLYGTVYNGSITPNSYAGYFDGRTYIGDTLLHFPVTSPTYYHNKVLTLLPSGKAAWRPVTTATVAPTMLIPGGIVNVNPVGPSSTYTVSAAPPTFSNVGIGTITGTYPSYLLNIPPPTFSTNGIGNIFGSYPNYALNVPAPNLTVLGNSITLTQGTVNVTQTISVLNGMGTTGYLPMYSSASTMSVSNMFRNLNNQIGINTISPKTFFHVFKPSGTDTMLLESPNGSSMAYALKNVNNRFAMTLNGAALKFEENGTDRMVFSAGNVGIGTSAPNFPLEVSTSNSVGVRFNSSSTNGAFYQVNATSAASNAGYGYLLNGNPAASHVATPAGDWILNVNNLNRINVIGSNGYVGIGIAAPNNKLHVAVGDVNIDLNQGYKIGNEYTVYRDASSVYLGSNLLIPTVLRAGTEKVRILTNGFVGIGTSSPTENMQLESTTSTDFSMVSASSNLSSLNFGTSANHFLGRVRYNASNNSMSFWTNNTADRMFINSAGNVGIGTTIPTTNSRLAIANGHIQVKQSTAPTITFSGGYAGTISLAAGSNDVAGKIIMNNTNAPCAGCAMATVTFNMPYAVAPIVIITPASLWGAVEYTSKAFFVNASTNGFTVHSNGFPVTGQSIEFNYLIIEAN